MTTAIDTWEDAPMLPCLFGHFPDLPQKVVPRGVVRGVRVELAPLRPGDAGYRIKAPLSLEGTRFVRILDEWRDPPRQGSDTYWVRLLCQCDTEYTVQRFSVARGCSSCGCLRRDRFYQAKAEGRLGRKAANEG